jgi:hypothetical protein
MNRQQRRAANAKMKPSASAPRRPCKPTGSIGILNVGAGDTKISFDPDNPAETAKAKRIVEDMLRRGYALMIEVQRKGKTVTRRVKSFSAEVCEYIIDDFPEPGEETASPEPTDDPVATASDGERDQPAHAKTPRRTARVSAFGTTGVAIARTAGG